MAEDQSREEGMLQLRWNSHLENLQHLFNSLLEEELFVDVTLACQGGILRAHRVVLSACSDYFRRVLHESSCKHPTVIMKDVQRSEMEAILRFMYRGEIEVAETQLDSLLSTARLLQVSGFSDQVLKDHAKNNEQKKVLNNKRKRNFSTESTPRCKSALSSGDEEKAETLEKMAADSPLDLSSEVSDKVSRSPDSSEPSSTTPMSVLMVGDVVKDIKKEEVGSETYPYTVLDEQTSGSLVVQAVCPFCFKDCKRTAELRAHIRGHTGEKPFRCDICNAPFARSAHLKRHRRVHTGEKPFECHRCQKTFSRQDKLKLHMDRHRLRDSGGKMVIGRPRKDTRPAQPNAQPQTDESSPPSSSPAAASTPTPTPSELGVGMGQFAFPGAPAARPGPPRSPMASLPPPSSPGLPLAFSEIGYLSLLSLSQRGLGVVSTSELPSPTMPHLLNPQTLQELQMLRKAATARSKGHRGRGQSSSGAAAATESATETLINLVQQAGEAPAQS